MFKRGQTKILTGTAATALLAAAAVLFLPGFSGRTPPPETSGGDVVSSGADFQSGDQDGTSVAPSTKGGDLVLALDPSKSQGGYVSQPARADYAFNAVGLHWKADMPPGTDVNAEVRFSQDGEQWGDWQPVEKNGDELPDNFDQTKSAGETIGDLVFTDAARYFQYKLDLKSNAAGQSPAVTRMTASYIDGKGYHESLLSASRIERNVGAALSPPQASADPAIISRAQWGANEAYMTWPPEYSQPKKIVIHHTVTMNGDPDPAATIRTIYYYHAVSLGWGDIGYNFLIDQQGRIYQGRSGGNGVIGAHALGWNEGTIGISVLGNYSQTDINGAIYNAMVSLIIWKANLNNIDPNGSGYFEYYAGCNGGCNPTGIYAPNIVGHRDLAGNYTECPGNYLYARIPQFRAEASAQFHYPPDFANMMPSNANEIADNKPLISADVLGSAVLPSTITMSLDGVDITGGATRTSTLVSYRPPAPLAPGTHTVHTYVADSLGSTKTADWTFTIAATNYTPHDYIWTWYDGVNSRNWVLMANPASSSNSLFFDLYIAGRYMNLSPFAPTDGQCPGFCGSAQVQPGRSMTPLYNGVMGGMVIAPSLTGAKAITSQRTIWGQNSFEELPGFDSERLTDHYYWTWYDSASAGYKNWILVANPNASTVFYKIRIAGNEYQRGTINPGSSVTPIFMGIMGGPVEVQAWSDGVDGAVPAKIMASQRVLSNGGSAFNEVPGIPVAELSDRYLWTWYDMQSAGARNWVLVANPNDSEIYYEITVAGHLTSSGTVPAGNRVTPTFPGTMGGPVEVQAWTDSGKSAPANVIASQRVVWGPSFEEVPGYPVSQLNSSYVWTWYDQKTAGTTNWALVSNPNAFPVNYEIRIAGTLFGSGTLQAGASATPTFPGTIGGPVEVKATTTCPSPQPANILASQRVLWNGSFNEVTGTVLDSVPGTSGGCGSTTVTSDASFEVKDGNGALLTTLAAGQTATVAYGGGSYLVQTSTGYSHSGDSYIRMSSPTGGIMQVTSYHDHPSWNQDLDDNRFRGAIEVRYSPASNKAWVVEDVPLEDYLKGIAETSSGDYTEYLKTMSTAARGYALWHLNNGGKYGPSEIFTLKNSRNGNGDDQQYKGYGLETRFPDLVSAVNATSGQAVTYGGNVAITPYYSNSDGRTRSALEAWGIDYWPWLQSVLDPDCNGMTLNGHGVGISAVGARARAGRGDSFRTILGYYYTGTAVQAVDTNKNIRIAITPVS
ncbi:MAG: N-acetylmuramoyl-L-alanine amidase [Actinobacteria bacterium]|nr:N-acetylmuramoyl-L-alanine amidase [Actinomycetota bacterium]